MALPVLVNLAVEDELSEAVLRTVLRQSGRSFSVGACYTGGGFGYLRNKIVGFNHAAQITPFVLLTDLDRGECAPKLVRSWLSVPKDPSLVFRVAVRAVEAWVMAHRLAFADFLGVSSALIPYDLDSVENPKDRLVRLAKRSRKRDVREDIIPRPRSATRQGPNYNGPLTQFVIQRWALDEAMQCSESLRKTIMALRAFHDSKSREHDH